MWLFPAFVKRTIRSLKSAIVVSNPFFGEQDGVRQADVPASDYANARFFGFYFFE
jgi:hypothetical protein